MLYNTKGEEIDETNTIMNRVKSMKLLETLPEVDEYIELVRMCREHQIWEDKLYLDKREDRNRTFINALDLNIEDYSMFLEDDDYDYWTPVTQGMDNDSYLYKRKLSRFLWILSRFPEYQSRDWEFLLDKKDKLVIWLREQKAKGKMWNE